MSSTTIRHSGVLENTQSAAHLATGQRTTGHSETERSARSSHHGEPAPRQRSQYPPGFGPGEPYYEPAHLRHKPGDDWKIGGRPHDPDDPGPYGTPGWYQDRRTGRHRRGELPDQLPEEDRDRTEWSAETPPHRFSRLREDAYLAFMRDSEELHLAHYETPEPSRAVIRLKWALRVLLAILYWRVIPFPESPARAIANSAARGTVRGPEHGPDGPGHGRAASGTTGTARSTAASRAERGTARRAAPSPGPRLPQVRFGLQPATGRVERRMIGGAAR